MAATATTGATPTDWEFDKFDDGSLSEWCSFFVLFLVFFFSLLASVKGQSVASFKDKGID